LKKESRQLEQGQVDYALHNTYEAMEKQLPPDLLYPAKIGLKMGEVRGL